MAQFAHKGGTQTYIQNSAYDVVGARRVNEIASSFLVKVILFTSAIPETC